MWACLVLGKLPVQINGGRGVEPKEAEATF